MTAALVAFYILSALIIGLALIAVLASNLVRAALALAFSFFMLSGIFWILGSPFVAILQLVVNAGAIPIVTIFIVMMTRSRYSRGSLPKTLWALVLCIPLAFVAFNYLGNTTAGQLGIKQTQQITPLSIERLGIELLSIRGRTVTQHTGANEGEAYQTVAGSILAFEATAIVLLVAFIGAIILAKHEPVLPNYSEAEVEAMMADSENNTGSEHNTGSENSSGSDTGGEANA